MPGKSHPCTIESDRFQFKIENIEAFLPFFPLAKREFVASLLNEVRKWPSSGSRAQGSSGCLDSMRNLCNLITIRLADGPIPLALLVTLSRRCDFKGLPLILAAASGSGLQYPSGVTFNPDPWGDPVGGGAGNSKSEEGPYEDWAGRMRVPGPRITIMNTSGAVGNGNASMSVESAFERLFLALGEKRLGQIEMAYAVMKALEEDRTALVEAGTGIGKSLAYLVPAVLFSSRTGERVLVSTYTRNLQEQLFDREVPILRDVLGIEVQVASLMGRESYICSRKVMYHVAGNAEEDPDKALALAISVALSTHGTVDSLPAPDGVVPPSLLAAPARCSMKRCGQADRCPLVVARRRAREAKVLFVNHALLMTDYGQGGSVLGPYRRVIFDEAHHLERCVMENLSVRINRDDIERILEPLRPMDISNDRWKLLLNELEANGQSLSRTYLMEKLGASSRAVQEAFIQIFRSAKSSLNPGAGFRGVRTRYMDGEEAFADDKEAIEQFLVEINRFRDLLNPILEVENPSASQGFQPELVYALEELDALSDRLKYLVTAQDEDSVFWLDWREDGALGKICGSPLSVNRIFADYLEETCRSAVLTSATLAQDGSFDYAIDQLGLNYIQGQPIELVIQSPFRYDENCLILAATGLGDPNDIRFGESVAEIVSRLARGLERRMMVLFTSYGFCHSTARSLGMMELPVPVLIQGQGEGREHLAERFRCSKGGILLGVASFWEGVDFPGEELEVLVIPKIPFPVPIEPIVEARSQKLKALGENPFEKLFLPEAILRLKQGIGRLIRRGEDRGIVVILDSRLASKPYGEIILSSLPSRTMLSGAVDEIITESSAWFGGC